MLNKHKDIHVVYNRYWVAMWFLIAIYLIVAIFVFPFKFWAVQSLVLFGIPEAIGVRVRRDSLPPLTYVLAKFVPRWLWFTVMYGLFGAAGAHWFGHVDKLRFALFMALLGWASNHFAVTYDHPEE